MSRPGDRGGEPLAASVAATSYPSGFTAPFSPQWIDAILRHRGLRPPRDPRGPFALVDLGCGTGLPLVLLGAAHPKGRFLGLDAAEVHVAAGLAGAREAAVDNADFVQTTFAAALAELEPESVDYVTAQGVLTWVGPADRERMFALAARLLRPGGVLVVGYNCFPGWTSVVPFQRLVHAVAGGLQGPAVERFFAAVETVRATGVLDGGFWDWFDARRPDLPSGYFPHEYLVDHWQPLWASEAIAMAAAQGLRFVGDAQAALLREDLALKRKWRETMAQFDDLAAREVARDLLTGNAFRSDIYLRPPLVSMDERQSADARLQGWWAASRAYADASFEARTPAGTIAFDNRAAHAILAMLEAGPAQLGAVGDVSAGHLLDTIDALFMAGAVTPAEPSAPAPRAAAANAVAGRGPMPVGGLTGSNGVFAIPRGAVDGPDAAQLARFGIGQDRD